MKWLYLIVAILAEVIATSALKYADGFAGLVPSATSTLVIAEPFKMLLHIV
jgi:small multidrug resistance pump